MKEMMDDTREELARNKSARKARSSRSVKAKPSEKAINSTSDSSSDTTQCNDTPVSDTAAEEENKNEALVGGVRQCDGPQVDPSCSNNTRPGPRKVRRKAPPPPHPAPPHYAPPQSRPSQPHPPGSQGLPQDSQETAAAHCEKHLNKTEKDGSGNYPEELNPFGEVDEGQDSLSLGSVGTFCKETPVQDVQPGEMSSTGKEGLIDHKGPSPCDETQTPDSTAHTEPIPKMEKPCKFFSHRTDIF